jgi:hypothetical protein
MRSRTEGNEPRWIACRSRSGRRPPCRRHRHQSRRPDLAGRAGGDRRHRAAAGLPRRRRRLYRIVDAAYEKRSIALSSNLHPAGFDELMPKTLATATVDRLLHHAHICQTSGDSMRLPRPSTAKERCPYTDPSMARPATRGQSPGHQWAILLTIGGQVSWPPMGRFRWPLTLRSNRSHEPGERHPTPQL